ncbi:hypothetical protein [Maribacter sp. UBA4516]|uniref:hypothetical protein n=1 Tax=Maribacter sp. UBA4516 TaxID=1946804 RepID=UPI00257B5F48|nr:hypothetical protein [Maribacter sp. UBA4516]
MRTLIFIALLVGFVAIGQDKPRTGLLFDDEAYMKTPIKAQNVAFQDVVTETTNASIKQFAPTIKNQGGYGTCVGWASAYYGRTIIESRLNNELDTVEINKNAFSPVFTYLLVIILFSFVFCFKF